MTKAFQAPAVKFADASRAVIEGYGIPYYGPFKGRDGIGRDLHKEFFSPDTDLCEDWFEERPLLYAHGKDAEIQAVVVGRVKAWERREEGVWVRAQLDKSSEYFEAIGELINAGKCFYSSGAMGHLVDTDRKTGEIKRWPWVEMSLTPTPANPDARLDYATAEKHLKDAGIKLSANLKAKLGGAKKIALRGVFERELAQRTPSVWEYWNALCCSFAEIAKAASVSEVTGATVDIDALVKEAIGEFSLRLAPAVAEQINAYLEDGCHDGFYIKSDSLNALIDLAGQLESDTLLVDHSAQVESAARGFVKEAHLLAGLFNGLSARWASRVEARVKEGRVLSAANREKLQKLQAQMGEAHAEMGKLLETTQKKPGSSDEDMKAARMRELEARALSLKAFQLRDDVAAMEVTQ